MRPEAKSHAVTARPDYDASITVGRARTILHVLYEYMGASASHDGHVRGCVDTVGEMLDEALDQLSTVNRQLDDADKKAVSRG